MSINIEAAPTIPPANPQQSDTAALDLDLAVARDVWTRMMPVNRVMVKVLVDNETDGLSTPCACCDPSLDPSTPTPYQSEFTVNVQQVLAGHRPCFDFTRTLQAAHGLSLLIEVTVGAGPYEGRVFTVLFDGGPSGELWAANAERLGINMGDVGAAVLSHWHVDHSVGLLAVAAAAAAARVKPGQKPPPAAGVGAPTPTPAPSSPSPPPPPPGPNGMAGEDVGVGEQPSQQQLGAEQLPSPPPPVPSAPQTVSGAVAALADFVFDVHPNRPVRRGLQLSAGGRPVPFNEDPTVDALTLPGCRVDAHAGPHALFDCFFVSGAIPRVTSFEVGQPCHVTLGDDGVWRPDPFIMEERYLALKLRDRGAVVFSGCSHAGIINVMTHLQQVSRGPVYAVMGGLHLAGRFMEPRIPETITALRQLGPHLVLAGHCTGWKAKAALAAAFPGHYQPISVGGTYAFLAPPCTTDAPGGEQGGVAAEESEPEKSDLLRS